MQTSTLGYVYTTVYASAYHKILMFSTYIHNYIIYVQQIYAKMQCKLINLYVTGVSAPYFKGKVYKIH